MKKNSNYFKSYCYTVLLILAFIGSIFDIISTGDQFIITTLCMIGMTINDKK